MRRTERLGVILTPAEKLTIERLAEAEGGLSLAAIVRRLIRMEGNRKGLWPPQCYEHERAQTRRRDTP